MRISLSVLIFGVALTAAAQPGTFVDANTTFFTSNVSTPDTVGHYTKKPRQGFYWRVGQKTYVSLLPTIAFGNDAIKAFDKSGAAIDPDDNDIVKNAEVIEITPTYLHSSPTNAEKIGLVSSIENLSISQVILPPLIAGALPAVRNPALLPQPYFAAIQADYQGYQQQFSQQQQVANKANDPNKYDFALVPPRNLNITLRVAGEILAQRSFQNNLLPGNKFPPLTIKHVPPEVRRRLLDGQLNDVEISFAFLDTNVGSVDVTFDSKHFMSNYIRDTQTAISTGTASGWSVFGIGSRRMKFNQEFTNTLSQKVVDTTKTNTRIITRDANQSQLELFERNFFPSLSKDQAVQNHLASAQRATASGRPDLAKAHANYAAALNTDDKVSTEDSIKAAAALSAGDYASFVAEGVRFSRTSVDSTASYARVLDQTGETIRQNQWEDYRQYSVYRDVTLVPSFSDGANDSAFWGLCGYRLLGNFNGTLITCVADGSALAAGNVRPGDILFRIDTQAMDTQADLNKLPTMKPGVARMLWLNTVYGQMIVNVTPQ